MKNGSKVTVINSSNGCFVMGAKLIVIEVDNQGVACCTTPSRVGVGHIPAADLKLGWR